MKENEKIHALAILENFTFKKEDYLPDYGLSLTEKALALYSGPMKYNDVGPDIQNFFARQIERLYHLMVQNDGELSSIINDGDILCSIDGHIIMGKIIYSPKEIIVSYVHDGVKETRKSIIIPFSSLRYTVEPYIGSEINDYGIHCATELLFDMYYRAKAI